MATAVQMLMRKAVLTRLKNDAALLALVPKAQIDPQGEPTWPFVTIESPTTQRLRMACVNGGRVTFDLHAFAAARLDGGAEVETARDHAGRIGGEIERVLADNRLTLIGGEIAKVALSDIRLLPDGDPDRYHWFAQLNARVLAS